MQRLQNDIITDYRALFLNDTPLLDVRAPVEFKDGAFPTAENHPLMDDEERSRVGSSYKHEGQEAAVSLGHNLVSGELRQRRIKAWQAFFERYPDGVLYCFRGGMRSQIVQQWLQETTGKRFPRVAGGYKALRQFLLAELDNNATRCRPVVIGGRTGCGKTRLLRQCEPAIDLEGLANHRGSAFGGHPDGQPSQIDFENALSIRLIRQTAANNAPFLVEDESRNIGSRHIRPTFYQQLRQAPLVLLDVPFDKRIDITLQEYVVDALAEYTALPGIDDPFSQWRLWLTESLTRIQRRLGGTRYADVNKSMQHALDQHYQHSDIEAHRDWIAHLLRDYYDHMYDYQIESRREQVVFHGNETEVLKFLQQEYGIGRNAGAPKSAILDQDRQ